MSNWEEERKRVIVENIASVQREIEQAKQEAEKRAKADQLRIERTHFIRLLTKARLNKKLSQASLAAKLGMSQSVIARIESGHGNPTLGTLLVIAKALDVNLMLEYKQ